jgi:diphthamide synthase (EF-2-diphthine--ammonia ligase)
LKDEIYQTEQELDNTRTRVQKEFEELEVQRKRLVDAVASGSIDSGDIRDKMNEIKLLREEKEKQIQQLKERLELFDIEYMEVGAKFSEDHLTQFNNATIEEKRKMYRYAVKEIKVRGRKIEIAFITGIRYYFRVGEWEPIWDRSGPLRDYLDRK